jgi:hypothetical protein
MSKKRKKKRAPRHLRFQAQAQANKEIRVFLATGESTERSDDEIKAALDEFVKRFGRQTFRTLKGYTDGPMKTALMVGLPHIADEKTISWLWGLARSRRTPMETRSLVLVILKATGEDVDLTQPEKYFPVDKITVRDLDAATRLFEQSQREITKSLQRAESTDEVERIMMILEEQQPLLVGGEAALIDMMNTVTNMGDTGAADYLLAVLYTTPRPRVREAARRGLDKLRLKGIEPQTPIIKALGKESFYRAYTTDPNHPWQQNVMTIWEREPQRYQVMSFLLDFGSPWNGAIKDMMVTRSMSFDEIEEDLIGKSATRGLYMFEIDFDAARGFVTDALRANKRNRIKLPTEYDQFRHLIERRFLNIKP